MKVTEIVTIEPCRDGETLIAQFNGENEVHHCLELRVILGKVGEEFEIRGYKKSVLKTYTPSFYGSTVTRIKHPKFNETEEKLVTF